MDREESLVEWRDVLCGADELAVPVQCNSGDASLNRIRSVGRNASKARMSSLLRPEGQQDVDNQQHERSGPRGGRRLCEGLRASLREPEANGYKQRRSSNII